jgi:signal transduction histidine kinase
LVIGLAASLILGQCAAADSPFTVDVWNTDDGLPENAVIALTQTRDGYLWVGTQGGLARFDGNSFTPFNVNNTPGLPDDVIVFLFEDSHANFWVGTHNGALCLIQNGALKNIFNLSGANGKISAAFEDKDGLLWFATDGGGFPDQADFFCWRNGELQHVSGLQGQFQSDLSDMALHGSLPCKDGSRWVLKGRQVARWRDGRPEKYFGTVPWGGAIVTAACVDDSGNFIVGTRGAGLYWFDGTGGFRHLTKSDGLSEDYVLSLCFDSENNLWVGTDGGGLDRVKKKIFTAPAALSGGVPQSMAEDAQGGIWTAFNLGGLIYWNTNAVRHYGIPPDNSAWTVLVDSRQEVWAGTGGQGARGLFHLQNNIFQPVPGASDAGQKIFSLCRTRSGNVLVGGENGLASFDGRQWKFFPAGNELPKSPVRALVEDTNGVVWIGTETEGLYELKDEKISKIDSPVKDVSALLAGDNGGMWAGSFGHGLAWRSAAGEWKLFSSTLNGLANDDIGSLAEDDSGNLWIGSYEGIVRVDKRSIADVLSGTNNTLICRTFLTRECTAGAQPSALRTRDGRLWFPTIGAVVSINPADLKPNTNPPPVVIESVTVDGVAQKNSRLSSTWPQVIVLQPENEQLEIHFTALNFSAPKRAQLAVQFKYQIEGRDKNPTPIGGERVAHFGKLSPGRYIFNVTACNEDGYWNDTGASIAVIVEPPFWRKPGFITAGILILLGVLAGTIYLISTAKLRRQLRLAQQKELIEHERARIARDLHDQLGANLTQITLLGEMAEADKEIPAEIEQHAEQICATARETTRSLDEIVWAVNPSNDTLESLTNYACKYAQDYFAMAGVSYRAELPPGLPPTPILPEVRHNVFLAFKEAVNNVVKHAHATEARVKLQLEPERFILTVADNGRGLGDISQKSLRNGMKNMRRRLADVRGEFEIAPGAAGGTVVKLTVPLKTKA